VRSTRNRVGLPHATIVLGGERDEKRKNSAKLSQQQPDEQQSYDGEDDVGQIVHQYLSVGTSGRNDSAFALL
jgi:hypothetical protein